MDLPEVDPQGEHRNPAALSLDNAPNPAVFLDAIPAQERQRIVSGMRWTVWLAIFGAPFGYVTSLILARTSPEALGTYGLLLIYIQLVQTWLYLGGDAVVIRFLPRVSRNEQLAFLCSYFLLIVLALIPWLVAASLWPSGLRYVFGDRGGKHLQLLILYLAPVCIFYWFLLATLKARLEMMWAQGLFRAVTLGCLLTYGTMLLIAPHLLADHYALLIWVVYFGFVAFAIFLALWKLLGEVKWNLDIPALRLFLPRGFWHYLIPLQVSSTVSMAASRIDYILVLNFGGLKTLGEYLAIVMMADLMRVLNSVLLDTLLPALSNLLPSDNFEGAQQVFAVTMRILFVANAVLGCALIFLAAPILDVLGPQYSTLTRPMILLMCLATLSAPAGICGTLLSSLGKQYRVTWLSLARLGLSAGLFITLWPHYGLLGAALACGLAMLIFSLALPLVAKIGVPVKFSIASHYVRFTAVVIGATLVCIYFGPFQLGMGALLWLTSVAIFLVISRYHYSECKELARYLLPPSTKHRTTVNTLPSV